MSAADRYLQQEVDAMAESSTINATCVVCTQEAEYSPGAFQIVRLETELYVLAHQYEFFCTKCYGLSQQKVTKEVYDVLAEAGVRQDLRLFPEEVAEQWMRLNDPVLCQKDLADLLTSLAVLEQLPADFVAANGGSQQGES